MATENDRERKEKIKENLISEYDHVILELNQQIQQYKAEAEALVQKVQEVTNENERLNLDIQKVYQLQLNSTSDDIEKESHLDLWRQACTELEQAQKSNMDKSLQLSKYKNELLSTKGELQVAHHSIKELKLTCEKLQMEHQQSLKTAKSFDTEMTSLQEDLSQCRGELSTVKVKNAELKSLLDKARAELTKKSAEIDSASMRETSSNQRAHALQSANVELEAKLSAIQQEFYKLSEDKPDLITHISTLREKLQVLESREQAAVEHVRESVQLLEKALAEKEQTEIKEQHHLLEIKRLKKTIATLLDEAGSKTKAEVDKVREEYNRNIDAMANEIQQLEKQCCEKLSHCEKLQREKEDVEKELQKTILQCPQEQTWVKDTLSDLRTKLLSSERNRHELGTELKSLQTIKTKLDSRLLEEQQKSAYLLEDLQAQRKQNQNDCQHYREEISSLTDQCKTYQEEITSLTEKLKFTEKENEKKLKMAQEQSQVREKELLLKAKCAQEANQQISLELRQQLISQQQAANRWQRETSALTSKFEKALLDMNTKVTEERRKSKELTSKLKLQTANTERLHDKISEQEQVILNLHERVYEAESKADQRKNQLSLLVAREKKTLKEKQDMHRLLNKARLEMARNLSMADTKLLECQLHSSEPSFQNNTLLLHNLTSKGADQTCDQVYDDIPESTRSSSISSITSNTH